MLKIGTHNGKFHCDEVLACFLLKQLPQYKDATIIRSRDINVLNECDIVVDVGDIFDPNTHRYDHHQRAFRETFKTLRPEKPWNIKLSSAGLIYVHFGEQVLEELCKNSNSNIDINILFDKMYESFVMEIDAIDNGVAICEGEPMYAISSCLTSRVNNTNPWWNQKEDENARFMKAMELVGSEFLDRLNYYIKCWWPARELVQKAIDSRFEVHNSGLILKFEECGCPWKSFFFDLEQNISGTATDHQLKVGGDGEHENKEFQILFVLYSDGSMWRVQCIPVSEKQGFQNRLGLLEEWRGLRNESLEQVTEIEGCTFVHNNGFIGGNKTYEGALAMALKTIERARVNNSKISC